MPDKPTREIHDYLDAQLSIIHDLRQEGVKANGIYLRESPVPVSAVTREFVTSRLCGPSLRDSAGQMQHGIRNGAAPVGSEAALLEAVKEGKRPKGNKALLVDVEATHVGMTKNFTYYTADNMEKSAKTWLEPYQKPVITHHRNQDFFVKAEDPIGRVIKHEFKDSALKPGTKTILLRHRITDPEAQQKIIDGRYQTTSIGAIASSLHCSVCGNNLMEDWCGHRRGQTYDYKKDENTPAEKKLCYWIVGEMWYEEDSYVNTPADEMAQVVHFEWEEEAESGRRESSTMETAKVTDNLDDLLGGSEEPAKTQEQAAEAPKEDPSKTQEQQDPTDPPASTEPTVEEKLATLEAENKDLKEKLALAETEAQAARTEAEEATAAKVKAEQELAVANAENKQMTERATKLASIGRQQLIERVVDLKIATGEAKEEERTALTESMAKKKPSDLTDMAKRTLESRPVRTPATVTSPGQISTGEVAESASEAPKTPTLKDMEDALLQAMSLRQK